MRILFVDNHPEFTSVTLSFLSEHDVVVVPTIAAARAEFQQASRFDVALVDYDLDDGKGDELVRWLRSEGNTVPVIAVSARAEGNEKLIAAGASSVCAKLQFSGIQRAILALT